jgi:hypothetical protein
MLLRDGEIYTLEQIPDWLAASSRTAQIGDKGPRTGLARRGLCYRTGVVQKTALTAIVAHAYNSGNQTGPLLRGRTAELPFGRV